MRILAVDPGSRHIGLALSDPSGTIASPLTVINHISRLMDAATVVDLAHSNQVGLIVIGQSLDEDGTPTFEGRRARRFAETLKMQTSLPVVFWDEAFTTRDARSARIQMGVSRRDRSGHLDSLAAVILLQSFINAQIEKKDEES
ncbi:MAG TPA: Holliday junction resolvase RuvX [Anaerolineales bacterium]